MDRGISDDVAPMIWGTQSALFQRYGNYYRTRFVEGTRKPIPDPVTDIGEALVLLYENRDKSERRIKLDGRLPDDSRGPVIEISIYGGGYGKCELSDQYQFPIAPELVEELKNAGVLSGIPYMGYTDHTELRLNNRSTDLILEEIKKYAENNPEVAEPA